MSWHFSRAQVGAYLPGTCSDGAASAQSKSTSTLGEYCSPARTTEASQHSPCGMTSGHSTRCRGAAWSMSCLADFPAPTSQSLAADRASTAKIQDFGRTWPESFATFDPDSCSWRTRQPLLIAVSDEFSATWPRSGTMQNGECWERMPLERRIVESVFGLWLPTPTVSGNHNRKGSSATSGDGLATAVAKMAQHGGPLNPTWVEWLMGWPLGWTVCGASATVRSRNARRKHGGSLRVVAGGDD